MPNDESNPKNLTTQPAGLDVVSAALELADALDDYERGNVDHVRRNRIGKALASYRAAKEVSADPFSEARPDYAAGLREWALGMNTDEQKKFLNGAANEFDRLEEMAAAYEFASSMRGVNNEGWIFLEQFAAGEPSAVAAVRSYMDGAVSTPQA